MAIPPSMVKFETELHSLDIYNAFNEMFTYTSYFSQLNQYFI